MVSDKRKKNRGAQLRLRNFTIGVAAVAMLMAVVPSVAKKKTVKPAAFAVSTRTLSYDDSLHYNYFFLQAVDYQTRGNYAAAFDLLNHCLDINPNAAEAYFLQSMYLSELGRDSAALVQIELASRLNPSNNTYLEQVARHYTNARDYDKAIAAFERLARNNRSRTDVLNVLIQLYQQRKDYDNMLRCINRVEQVEGTSEDITLSKMRVYELKGSKKMAWKTLKALSDEHPSDVNYKVMMGNWLMQHKQAKKAYKIFADALKEEPDNNYAQTSLYDYYQQTGQDSLATQLRDRILISKKTPEQGRLSMMRQVIQQNEAQGGDSTEVLTLFNRMMAADPDNANIAGLKAVYMDLKHMPQAEIDDELRHVLSIEPDNAAARLQLIQNMWPDGDATKYPATRWDSIIAVAKPATQYNPDEMAFYYFEGMAYYLKNDEDSALDAFRRGVTQIKPESNKDMVSNFYAVMGDILYTKSRSQEAFAAYDSCLQWKSDNISTLNNYAYYLSLMDSDLTRAEQMSYRTIKAEPDNPVYLDTYAWILFKQHRYDEAKTYEDMAIKADTDTLEENEVYLEHAGDINAMLGNTDEAVDYWKRALEKKPDDALLPKKIQLRKYIAK